MNKKKFFIYISSFIVILALLLTFTPTLMLNIYKGRVHFPEQHIGIKLTMEDGKEFVVFRRLKIGDKTDNHKGGAVFLVKFQFNRLSPSMNKRLSMIPALFLMGMKGFQEKYWMFDEEGGFFQGLYLWESKEFAERYPGSFIFKLMTKRSVSGTLSYEIMPDTDLSAYISKLSSES